MARRTIRVAVCQLESHPALSVAHVNYLCEPFVPRDGDLCLATLGVNGLSVSELQDLCSTTYTAWQLRRLTEILAFLETLDRVPELLTFPECSMPYQALPLLKAFCEKHKVVALAGTHTYQKIREARRIYRDCGLAEKHLNTLNKGGANVHSVLPVIRGQRMKLYRKISKSPFERDDVAALDDEAIEVYAERINDKVAVLPLVCSDALRQPRIKGDFDLVAILSYEQRPSRFDAVIDQYVSNKKPVLYCNDGVFGGSRVVTASDKRSPSWFRQSSLGGRMPVGESVLVVDLDLDATAVEFGTSVPSASYSIVLLSSLTHRGDTDSGSVLSARLEQARVIDNQDARIAELGRLAGESVGSELQAVRLNYLHTLAQTSQDNEHQWQVFGRDLCLEAESLRQIEAKLAESCNQALQNQLTGVKGEVAIKLVGFLGACQELRKNGQTSDGIPVQQRTGGHAKGVFDRDEESETIIRFLDDKRLAVLQVSGMEGIGKSLAIEKAFEESGLQRILRVPLAEGSSAGFLAFSILRTRYPSIAPPYADVEIVIRQEEFRSVLRGLDALVLERCGGLADNGQWLDESFGRTLTTLIDVASEERSHVVLETRRELPLDYPRPYVVARTRVKGLPDTEAIRYLEAELRRVGVGPDALTPDQKGELVRLLGGHPVGLSWVAEVIPETGPSETVEDLRKKRGIYLRITGQLLSSLRLDGQDTTVLKLVNGCRIPAPRSVIVACCDFPAGEVIRRLIEMCLLELDERAFLGVAGIVRTYFEFSDLLPTLQEVLHEHAAAIFKDLATKPGSRLEYAVEADYHSKLLGKASSLSGGLADSTMAAVSKYYRDQEYELAAQTMAPLLKSVPIPRQLLKLAAVVYAQLGNFDEALVFTRQAFAGESADPYFLADLTRIALKLKRGDVAEDLIGIARRAGINDYDLALNEGRLLFSRGQIAGAEERLQRARELTTRNAWPHYYLGKIYIKQGEMEKAIEVLYEGEQLLYEIDSRNRNHMAAIRTLLVQAYLFDNDLDAAGEVITNLVEERPNDPEIVRTYAAYTLQRDGVADAKKAFEELSKGRLRSRIDRCQMHLFLGLFYLGINEPMAASREFAEAHKEDRNNVFVMMKLARTLFDLAQTVRADDSSSEIAQGHALDCARIVQKILQFAPENKTALHLQERLYSMFGIDTGKLEF